MDGNSIFATEAFKISDIEPGLKHVLEEDGRCFIQGTIELRDAIGNFVDSYQIKIFPIAEYPYRFPHVFETGGRIPVNIDWHVFPDGHCCVKAFPEELLLCKEGIDLSWFLETQLKPYFFNQKHKEVHGYFLNERSHGRQGNIDFFEEVFQTTNLKVIAKYLLRVKKGLEPGRSAICFCGSGVKYRKCHREVFRLLSKFDESEMDYFIDLIITSPKFSLFYI